MENVEPMSFLFRVESRRQRVDHGFAGAVAQSEQKRSPIKTLIGGLFADEMKNGGRSNRDQCRKGVERKRDCHERPITHAISKETEENNGDAKTGQTASGNAAQLALGETKLCAPVEQDSIAYGKTDTSGNKR